MNLRAIGHAFGQSTELVAGSNARLLSPGHIGAALGLGVVAVVYAKAVGTVGVPQGDSSALSLVLLLNLAAVSGLNYQVWRSIRERVTPFRAVWAAAMACFVVLYVVLCIREWAGQELFAPGVLLFSVVIDMLSVFAALTVNSSFTGRLRKERRLVLVTPRTAALLAGTIGSTLMLALAGSAVIGAENGHLTVTTSWFAAAAIFVSWTCYTNVVRASEKTRPLVTAALSLALLAYSTLHLALPFVVEADAAGLLFLCALVLKAAHAGWFGEIARCENEAEAASGAASAATLIPLELSVEEREVLKRALEPAFRFVRYSQLFVIAGLFVVFAFVLQAQESETLALAIGLGGAFGFVLTVPIQLKAAIERRLLGGEVSNET